MPRARTRFNCHQCHDRIVIGQETRSTGRVFCSFSCSLAWRTANTDLVDRYINREPGTERGDAAPDEPNADGHVAPEVFDAFLARITARDEGPAAARLPDALGRMTLGEYETQRAERREEVRANERFPLQTAAEYEAARADRRAEVREYVDRTAVCNCNVQHLVSEVKFVTRRGMHALTCPLYRQSADPLDAAADKTAREHYSFPDCVRCFGTAARS